MTNHTEINERIRARSLHTGFDEGTYYTQDLYNFAVDNYRDPLVLFKIKIYGYYAKKYKWSKDQADWFIEVNSKDAIGHSDGNFTYLYDWGIGYNSISKDPMHEPNLDHINPRSISNDHSASNFRIRCARLNENKGNMTNDYERRATIIDMFMDMNVAERTALVEYLKSIQNEI